MRPRRARRRAKWGTGARRHGDTETRRIVGTKSYLIIASSSRTSRLRGRVEQLVVDLVVSESPRSRADLDHHHREVVAGVEAAGGVVEVAAEVGQQVGRGEGAAAEQLFLPARGALADVVVALVGEGDVHAV